MNYKTPDQITESYLQSGIKKAKTPLSHVIMLGIFAGMYIAIGACCSMVAIHNIPDVGIAKMLAGAIFPVGLMLIAIAGGELFTGDCLMILGSFNKKYSVWKTAKTLAVVLFSNAVGAILIAGLVYLSGQEDLTGGALGAYVIKNAIFKANLDFVSVLVSGVLCNILVCAALLVAAAANDIAGKVLGIFFPIFVFVISGFEHVVANLYYIPAGIFAKLNPLYVQKAMELYGITQEQIDSLNVFNGVFNNLLPAMIGNVIGGMFFIALPLHLLYLKNRKNNDY